MKLLDRTGIATAALALALVVPGVASAAAPTFTANETVANVAQVKATRTITVASVPSVPVTLTIGSCAITVTGSVASDVDCSNNNAAIATSTDTTAAAIASRLRTITGLSDNVNGHGALTIGSSSTDVSFTTTGTEASSTSIFASQSTGTNFTLGTINTAGVVPVAQTVTFTPTDPGPADVFIITINGTAYAQTVGANDTVATLVADLNASLASNTAVSCSQDGVKVTCASVTAGTAFTYNADVNDNVAPSGGGGGGSGHRSSSGGGSSNSTVANHGTVTAMPAAPALANASPNAAFNRDLTVGVSGSDVMMLQKYLNTHGYVIASAGPGSAGNETSFFGALTRAALVKLQMAAGITPTAGYFGPKTRAYIAAHP